jgi:hypothetical protein
MGMVHRNERIEKSPFKSPMQVSTGKRDQALFAGREAL